MSNINNSPSRSPRGTLGRTLGLSLGSLAAADENKEIVLTRYANIQTDQGLESRNKHDSREQTKLGPLSNKLWSIAQLNRVNEPIDIDSKANMAQLAGPFQIVWTELSFQVRLSTYDRVITNILSAKQAFNRFSLNKFLAGDSNGKTEKMQSNSAINVASLDTNLVLDKARSRLSESLSSSSNNSINENSNCSSNNDKRTIFSNLNGYIKSGEISAILGPSGAGKTSLLNALCGRTDNYTGQIRLIGATEPKQRMRRSIIPQKDYLIENLTVRENLLYSSRILNPDKDDCEHEANILRVVKMLNLTACFNSIAANISGGEYKRVSIAQELLRQPDILILDEPTSGLDSLNCKNLIRSLVQLIEASRCGQLQPIAIVMTIHQPDVDIFNMFDHVYCMARGGRVIYDGHPRDCMQILRSQVGLAPKLSDQGQNLLPNAEPLSTNPANLLIEIASEDIFGLDPINRLANFYRKQFEQIYWSLDHSHEAPDQYRKNLLESNDLELGLDKPNNLINNNNNNHNNNYQPISHTGQPRDLEAASSISSTSLVSSGQQSTGAIIRSSNGLKSSGRKHLIRDKRLNVHNDHSGRFWYHTQVLASRAFVSTIRDPLMTMIAFLFHLSIPFVMWLVYPKRIGHVQACPVIQRQMDMVSMASNRTTELLLDLPEQLSTTFECSTMFFLTTYSFSMCSLTVTSLAFPLNMHIILKEVRNGWYNLPSYVLAKTLANFPFEVLFPVLSLVMIYLMLDMPSSQGEWRLLAIALVMALVSMISHTQGLIFGALCMDSVQTAIFLASASSLPQTLLSGFTARIKYMPWILQQASWLSQYRYSSDLINMIRFGFGICPCDQTTEEYLRSNKPDFVDVPAHLKPIFSYYLASATDSADNATTTINPLNITSEPTIELATIPAVNSSTPQVLAGVLSATNSATAARIPGVDYSLLLEQGDRQTLLKQMESGEVDLFSRMADMTGRSFSFGRQLDTCDSVRSQLLVTAGTPPDSYLPFMFGCLFALLIVCKIILFLVVRQKIGSRV